MSCCVETHVPIRHKTHKTASRAFPRLLTWQSPAGPSFPSAAPSLIRRRTGPPLYLTERTWKHKQILLLLSREIKKSLKMEDSWIAEGAPVNERGWGKYAFIGGALITVQVKLNMSEISWAAGVSVCGGWGALQSRGGQAAEEQLSPNVLFPASYLQRGDKELDT